MEMMMQQWRQEAKFDGIKSGSWYHYLPIGILIRRGRLYSSCVRSYMEVRPGCEERKRDGTSASRDENGQMDV